MPAYRSGEDFLRAAHELTGSIKDARNEIERTRLIPATLISALQATGIFRMWLPHDLGGPQLSVAEFVRVVEALSYVDGSVGWCTGLGAAYSRFAAYLPEAIATQIFQDNILAGTLAPNGRGTKVAGGYRVTGRWSWGSGIMHSRWLIVAFLTQADNNPRWTARNAAWISPEGRKHRSHRHLERRRPARHRQP